jgi:hypothetical protein
MNIVITAATATDLNVQLAEGTAQVHAERANGTFRRYHFLAEGTEARENAEWVRLQRTGQEADGDAPAVQPRSMKSIATELHVSVSAVRRVLTDLAITEELEEAEQDELEQFFVGAESA